MSRTIPRRSAVAVLLLASLVAALELAGCAASGDLEVLYFFDPACPSCEQGRRLLAESPSLRWKGRVYEEPDLTLYDVSRSEMAVTALLATFDKYRVPPRGQEVPFLVVNGRWYAGFEDTGRVIRELAGR